jgi:hypothetical protein
MYGKAAREEGSPRRLTLPSPGMYSFPMSDPKHEAVLRAAIDEFIKKWGLHKPADASISIGGTDMATMQLCAWPENPTPETRCVPVLIAEVHPDGHITVRDTPYTNKYMWW